MKEKGKSNEKRVKKKQLERNEHSENQNGNVQP